MKELLIDLDYFATTYGMPGAEFELVRFPQFSITKLRMTTGRKMSGRVAADYEAIKAIGSEPDAERVSAEPEGERPFNIAKELDEVDTLMEAFESA